MDTVLVAIMRVTIWVGMIVSTVGGGMAGYGAYAGYYGVQPLRGFVLAVPLGVFLGFLTGALLFGVIAILLKIERNTRPQRIPVVVAQPQPAYYPPSPYQPGR